MITVLFDSVLRTKKRKVYTVLGDFLRGQGNRQ